MLRHYRKLGEIRKKNSALHGGDFEILCAQGGFFAFVRQDAKQVLLILTQRSAPTAAQTPPALLARGKWRDLYTGKPWNGTLPQADAFCILRKEK